MARFIEATGPPLGEGPIAERIEEAKRLLIEHGRYLEEIAAAIGMGSADTSEHHFRQRIPACQVSSTCRCDSTNDAMTAFEV